MGDKEGSTSLVRYGENEVAFEVDSSDSQYLESPVHVKPPDQSFKPGSILFPKNPVYLRRDMLFRDMQPTESHFGDLTVRPCLRTMLYLTPGKWKEGSAVLWSSARFTKKGTITYENNPDHRAIVLGNGPLDLISAGVEEGLLGLEQVRRRLGTGSDMMVFTIMHIVSEYIEGVLLRPTRKLVRALLTNPQGVVVEVREIISKLAKELGLHWGKWSFTTYDPRGERAGFLLTNDRNVVSDGHERPRHKNLLTHTTVTAYQQRDIEGKIATKLKGLVVPIVTDAVIEAKSLMAIAPIPEVEQGCTTKDGEFISDPRWTLPPDYFQALLRGEDPEAGEIVDG